MGQGKLSVQRNGEIILNKEARTHLARKLELEQVADQTDKAHFSPLSKQWENLFNVKTPLNLE